MNAYLSFKQNRSGFRNNARQIGNLIHKLYACQLALKYTEILQF